MTNRLLVFGSFAHDPQRILAAVYGFAFVGIKCSLNSVLGIGPELRVATLAYPNRRLIFNYPQLAPWHASSLAHLKEEEECL